MAVQIVMDHNGDTRHVFDASNAKELARAEKRFKELTGAASPRRCAPVRATRRLFASLTPRRQNAVPCHGSSAAQSGLCWASARSCDSAVPRVADE